MNPDELAARFSERFGESATPDLSYEQLTVDVPAGAWLDVLTFARDELGCTFFDWLTGVDELDEGFSIVAHAWSPVEKHHVLVRTRVPRDNPVLPSATAVFRGANWHERETYEMFGVEFSGHPNLVPLLLPDGFEGHPLRKEFVLAARAAKAWPGAKEPGESEHDLRGAPSRRRILPPGVPDSQIWGPRPPGPGDTGQAADAQPEPGERADPAGGSRRARDSRAGPSDSRGADA
jgi:NADH-quinone oxidoreductase subunit C